jgi:N-sulfoglucosamine sulfohydrolase
MVRKCVEMQAVRPNILYIHSHDTGRYIQPYGYGIPTPHIQRLAQEGILFRKAFSAAPTCSPSRASLLTGQHPHSNGMLGLAHRGFSLYDATHHLPYTLHKEAGYYTALVGEEHTARDFSTLGYDFIAPVKEFSAKTIAPVAISILRDGLPQPFFLSVGFSETHREFAPPTSSQEENYTLPPAPLPDTPEIRRDMAQFKASAALLDQGIGDVLAALDEAGLAEQTLVICTTDHGIPFPLMKGSLTDHGIGVMLIMRGPGGFTGGKVCDALVSQIDIFPTLCDLLAVNPPSWLQGRSILPLIHGETDAIHDAIFAEVTYHAAYEPVRAVRTERWKYIRRFDQYDGQVLPNCDDGLSKDVLLEAGWQEKTRPVEQLYDLLFDPNEACNLAEQASYRLILQKMRDKLNGWMRETNDPLLEGPVPAPLGAVLNSPEQASPGYPTYTVSQRVS